MGRLKLIHRRDPKIVWDRISNFLAVRSPETQDTYCGILKEWCSFIGGTFGEDSCAAKILEISDSDAARYKSWLETREGERPRAGGSSKLSNATIAKKLAMLRKLYSVLMEVGLKSNNPFSLALVPPPPKGKNRKRPTQMLDFALVPKMLAAPDRNTEKGRRDRAIMAALFGGGLRRREVCRLRVGDLKRSRKGVDFLILRGTKAGVDADQVLQPWSGRTIRAWRDERLEQGAKPEDWLIPRYVGKGGLIRTETALSPSGLRKVFKSYAARVGAGPHVTPHSARATAITKLLVDGATHDEVRRFSRHHTVQMVEIYDKRRLGIDENAGRHLKFD